jgi:general secretion pathway protein L
MQRLRQVKLRYTMRRAFGIAGRAFGWWIAELAALVPAFIKGPFDGDRCILIYPEDDGVRFQMPDGGSTCVVREGPESWVQESLLRELQRADAVTFLLPSRQVLRRTLHLPLAAADDLASAIPFVIEQETPFPLENAAYAFRYLGRDNVNKQIRVEIGVTAKATIAYWEQWLQERRVRLSNVRVNGDKLLPRLEFPLRASLRRYAFVTQPWKPILTAALLAALLGPCLVAWVVHGHAARLYNLAGQAEARARQAETLRQQLQAASASQMFVKRLMSKPKTIQVLNAVTHAAADDTWLFDFDIAGSKLAIRGISGNVTALVKQLQASSFFSGVEFTAPVIHDPARRSARFEILLNVRRPGN